MVKVYVRLDVGLRVDDVSRVTVSDTERVMDSCHDEVLVIAKDGVRVELADAEFLETDFWDETDLEKVKTLRVTVRDIEAC